ncbi:MAG TPA: hypothetical protein VK985_10845 [Rariglobus sp.]|nr:hypothetical protein [Rariglobus sp.]
MNTSNSFAFVGVGFLMELARLTPAISAVRDLWLMVMGGVLMLTGGVFLAQMAWVWVKPRMITPMLVLLPRPAEARGREIPEGRRAAV